MVGCWCFDFATGLSISVKLSDSHNTQDNPTLYYVSACVFLRATPLP